MPCPTCVAAVGRGSLTSRDYGAATMLYVPKEFWGLRWLDEKGIRPEAREWVDSLRCPFVKIPDIFGKQRYLVRSGFIFPEEKGIVFITNEREVGTKNVP
jgi:hypothetical protein